MFFIPKGYIKFCNFNNNLLQFLSIILYSSNNSADIFIDTIIVTDHIRMNIYIYPWKNSQLYDDQLTELQYKIPLDNIRNIYIQDGAHNSGILRFFLNEHFNNR